MDELGRYLTENGWQGTLSEMDYLAAGPERISFVSKSMTTNETYMYFLNRLDDPVTIEDGKRSVALIYYGVAHSMTELDPYFACEAYDNSNSVYVLDSQGLRLFRSSGSSSDLLKGYNAYSTLEKMQYMHGTSFEEAKRELDATGIAYSNAIFNGEEYYYAAYKMDHAEWTLLFLVPSAFVAKDVVALVNTTVRLIMGFAVLMITVSTAVIFMILRLKQRQAVAAERKNNEALQLVNLELDHKNNELSAAVETAERAVQNAEAANRAKSEFLANMSHDIRTPMNAIVGITNLLEREEDDPEKLHSYIRKVQTSSQHLLSLINDVLDMSKIESGEVKLNAEPVNLADQVGQVDSIIRSQVQERGQNFTIHVHEIVHEYLIGDSVRLRQILINLLSNAVKYTPNGGTIDFDLAELPCTVPDHAAFRITVADTGYGMRPEFVKRIFEPFTRAENSVTNKVQGTGLGMAITKNIVDLMGGTIRVKSELDKGSCFVVELMLPIDQNAEHKVESNGVILISGDDVLRRNIRSSLLAAEVPFTAVDGAEEAEKLLADGKADIVLVSGFRYGLELQNIVSGLRKVAKERILVFCVDYAQTDPAEESLKNIGVDGLVARPFFLSGLLRAIEQQGSSDASDTERGNSVLRGMRFLCAEDNALNAEILEAILEMKGASCVIYPDGEKLVKAFANVKPGDYDAILMDIQMPNMNGLEASREIRCGENLLGQTIPIIAMTANAFNEDIRACLAAGMDAHISKPLDVAVMERTVARLTGKNCSGGGGRLSV